MINFPASSNMTDFEIVEIDNEHRRKIKARKRAVEFRANQERERQINQRYGKVWKELLMRKEEKTPN
jgi:hypothetical protein